MSTIKEKSIKEIEDKIEQLENIIAEKGVGSDVLDKAERMQRDLNLAILAASAATIVGVGIWALIRSSD